YSGTPLAKKLGIKAGSVCAQLGGPEGLLDGTLPQGATVKVDLRGGRALDVIVLFCADVKTMETRFEKCAQKLTEAGGLWIAWPKKASGVQTDLTETQVREYGLSTGLVDNKVCAIDEVWSGLRFVKRVVDRGR
ncbi:MAG: DUF3052 family protein, partial [Salinibacterium sp.]|nr:DUF3052 family protein [Salinibacterium sp.]